MKKIIFYLLILFISIKTTPCFASSFDDLNWKIFLDTPEKTILTADEKYFNLGKKKTLFFYKKEINKKTKDFIITSHETDCIEKSKINYGIKYLKAGNKIFIERNMVSQDQNIINKINKRYCGIMAEDKVPGKWK